MKKWIMAVGTLGTLATATTAGVNGSSDYCPWDSNETVIVDEVSYENEGVCGETQVEDELVIDMGDIIVSVDMNY